MSVKNVKAFFEKVEEDKSLQAKLKALDKKAKEDIDSGIGEMVKIAKAEGFGFTPQDLFKARSEMPKTQQLDEQVTRSAFEVVDKGCTLEGGCLINWPHDPDPPCPSHAHDDCPGFMNACGTAGNRE